MSQQSINLFKYEREKTLGNKKLKTHISYAFGDVIFFSLPPENPKEPTDATNSCNKGNRKSQWQSLEKYGSVQLTEKEENKPLIYQLPIYSHSSPPKFQPGQISPNHSIFTQIIVLIYILRRRKKN